jgi:hypothetical protein
MKANELRIGNIVQNIYKDTFGISQETLCDFANEYVNLQPIQLNEEWLISFGLNPPTISNPYHFKKSMVEFLYNGDELKCFYNDIIIFSFNCKYVHQLQNIYFDITGVELQLSSNVA